jgi:hypothetical protein
MTDTELSRPGPGRHAGADADAGPGLSTADAAGSDADFFELCLHESGHFAFAVLECCRIPDWIIATDRAGMVAGVHTCSSWQRGVLAAVGPEAGKIQAPCPARSGPPPDCWPTLPIQVDNALSVYRIAISEKSDTVNIAEAVIAGFEGCPDFWLERYRSILDAATAFVETHRTEIIQIAESLYRRGALTGVEAAALIQPPKMGERE